MRLERLRALCCVLAGLGAALPHKGVNYGWVVFTIYFSAIVLTGWNCNGGKR